MMISASAINEKAEADVIVLMEKKRWQKKPERKRRSTGECGKRKRIKASFYNLAYVFGAGGVRRNKQKNWLRNV